jgi:carbon-monoxide dehydrogenase small subunit
MILTAKAILDEEPHPTEATIKKKMAGNLCRCTGYKKIVEAVMSVTP